MGSLGRATNSDDADQRFWVSVPTWGGLATTCLVDGFLVGQTVSLAMGDTLHRFSVAESMFSGAQHGNCGLKAIPYTVSLRESRELSICQSLLCHILGSFHVLSQIRPQAPLLVVPIRPCLIFMFNVLSALPGFSPRLSQEILCIAKLMTANCSAESPTQHMRRFCSMAHISNTCNVPVALDMHTTQTAEYIQVKVASQSTHT